MWEPKLLNINGLNKYSRFSFKSKLRAVGARAQAEISAAARQ